MSSPYPQLQDREWLQARHQVEGMTPGKIADLLGCSHAGARLALIRTGLYQPKRRKEVRVLDYLTASRILADAAKVTTWFELANHYQAQRIVIQDRALVLGILEEVPKHFRPPVPGERGGLTPNVALSSPSWIARTWGQKYSMDHVAKMAGTNRAMVYRWLREHRMSGQELRYARNYALVTEYLLGRKLADVSLSYGLDPSGVFRILQAAGVDTARGRSLNHPWAKRPIATEIDETRHAQQLA